MASAGANVENVKVTQGLGDLPKVILTSVHGRYFNGFRQQFYRVCDCFLLKLKCAYFYQIVNLIAKCGLCEV